MPRYDYTALHRDYLDAVDIDRSSVISGPDSIASTVSSNSEANNNEEYKAKYERLQESYRRLQRNNISLEEKLLNVGEKFSADKNLITRDLTTQTQKVVEAKFTIQQLNKENYQLKSDLKIALKLLQNRPNTFLPQKLNSLPKDLQNGVRDYSRSQERDKNQRNGAGVAGGQRISVPLPFCNSGALGGSADNDEAVSAAILAKVLEQRERERNKDKKFCIDIGTQTHDWIFPDAFPGADRPPRSTDKSTADDDRPIGGSNGGKTPPESDESGNSKSTSSKSQSWESDFDSDGLSTVRAFKVGHVSSLLLGTAAFHSNHRSAEPLTTETNRSSTAEEVSFQENLGNYETKARHQPIRPREGLRQPQFPDHTPDRPDRLAPPVGSSAQPTICDVPLPTQPVALRRSVTSERLSSGGAFAAPPPTSRRPAGTVFPPQSCSSVSSGLDSPTTSQNGAVYAQIGAERESWSGTERRYSHRSGTGTGLASGLRRSVSYSTKQTDL